MYRRGIVFPNNEVCKECVPVHLRGLREDVLKWPIHIVCFSQVPCTPELAQVRLVHHLKQMLHISWFIFTLRLLEIDPHKSQRYRSLESENDLMRPQWISNHEPCLEKVHHVLADR